MIDWPLKKLKRLIVAAFGITLLIIGIAMIVLPGPAIVVVPLALGILATEYVWARRLLHRVRERIEEYRKSKNTSQKEKPL
jgi:uncharacterized protein (TIGR02611 family)